MEFILASHNENKVLEIKKLIPKGLKIRSLNDIGFHEEIEETGNTLEENSLIKAKAVFDITGIATIADDTGLEVEALDGAPGVYSARYAGSPKSDEKNIQKLLTNLEGQENRAAQFRTIFTLITKEEVHQFEGKVIGQIGFEKLGVHGFGYDPVFFPENLNRTFAQMNLEEKNRLSHRARALDKLLSFLNSKSFQLD